MKSTRLFAAAIAALPSLLATADAAGLPTRDLNPVLQPILIPSLVPVNSDNGWRVDHSLYITNTLQQKTRSGESVIIDVENYRYEFDLSYRKDNWRSQINIPLMANEKGELDTLIEDWHDFFGLPQGKRDDFPRDRIDIEYTRDGVVEYSQSEESSGLGDIALTLGYQPDGSELTWYAAIELPTGSESDYSGNEAIDVAFWVELQTRLDPNTEAFGIAGFSLPGDDGALEGLVADVIWVGQAGLEYSFNDSVIGIGQFDFHSESLDDTDLKPFGPSLQVQLGLGFPRLTENYRLDLFFSEDIVVESAPDITFGLRLSRDF